MSADKPSIVQIVGQSRLILGFFLLVSLALVAVSAISFQAPHLLGAEKYLTDFDAFHIAGTLAGEGRVADAYLASEMMKAQAESSGTSRFMPWTYPPPFTLLMDGFAALPIGVAYTLFILASFGFYLVILHRIAGPWVPAVFIALMPVILLNLRTGQNGFLVAGLIGAFLLAWRDGRTVAGLPLGLLIIKPHLAVGAGLLALLGRRWNVIALAAAVVLASLAMATYAYGFAVWADFLGAVREASDFLAKGQYPLVRMSSLYSSLRSAGLPASWAMAGHLTGALTTVGLLCWVALAKLEFRHRAALICVLSLFVSPYNYDYDLAMLGIGLAFIMPELADRVSARGMGALLAAAWITGGYGIAAQLWLPTSVVGTAGEEGGMEQAFICPLLIALCLAIWWCVGSRARTSGELPAGVQRAV